jgi:hypothetical protein
MNDQPSAVAAGTITIGHELVVNRLGFGAMRITGDEIWDEPADWKQAIATLRRCVDLGVNFNGTARTNGRATRSCDRSPICIWANSVRRTPSVSIRMIAWSRTSTNEVPFPPPVTSSRSRMNSSASVEGRDSTGPYRTSLGEAQGSGWAYRIASHLNRWCRFRCRLFVPP